MLRIIRERKKKEKETANNRKAIVSYKVPLRRKAPIAVYNKNKKIISAPQKEKAPI